MPDKELTEKDLMKGYWESYSKWQIDARNTKEKEVSTAKATMAVQGIGPDSPIYQAAISRLTQNFESDISSIESGQTKESLNKYFDQQNQSYSDYLNRTGEFGYMKYRGPSTVTPEWATKEEADVVKSIDLGQRKYDKGGVDGNEYQNALDKREELLGTRKNSSMEDFFTSQFGLGEKQKEQQVSQVSSPDNRRKLAPKSAQSSPWW